MQRLIEAPFVVSHGYDFSPYDLVCFQELRQVDAAKIAFRWVPLHGQAEELVIELLKDLEVSCMTKNKGIAENHTW